MDTGSRNSNKNYLLLKIIFKIDLNNVINYHKLSNTSNHELLTIMYYFIKVVSQYIIGTIITIVIVPVMVLVCYFLIPVRW